MEYLRKSKIAVIGEDAIESIKKYFGDIVVTKKKDVQGIKNELRGVDIVIGGCDADSASASEEIGVPYITSGVVTTILPDGIRFDELIIPKMKDVSMEIIRLIQCFEAMKSITGIGRPVFAPYGIEVESNGEKLKVRRVKLGEK